MSIKNIVFDMGNVLIKFDTKIYLDKYVKKQEDKSILNMEIFRSTDWVNMDRGTLSVDDAIKNAKKRIESRLHYCVEDLINGWHNNIEPIIGMEGIVKSLYESGYTLYLLSNTNICYYNIRKLIPGIKYFSGEFISADCKSIKPHSKIYNKFLGQFKVKPSECLFIDDSPLNIDGAIAVGMNGIVFHNNIDKLTEDFKKNNIKI